MNQKGFANIVLVVVIIILAGAAGYFALVKKSKPKICTEEAKVCPDGTTVARVPPTCEFTACPTVTQTPKDETKDWQIYRNKAYGFEFKYPPRWTTKEFSLNVPPEARPRGYVRSVGIGNNSDAYVGINIFDNSENLSVDKWVEENMGIIITQRIGSVDVNGITGLKYITSEMNESLNVSLANNNQMVNFYIDPNSKYQTTLDQILSTFRFID